PAASPSSRPRDYRSRRRPHVRPHGWRPGPWLVYCIAVARPVKRTEPRTQSAALNRPVAARRALVGEGRQSHCPLPPPEDLKSHPTHFMKEEGPLECSRMNLRSYLVLGDFGGVGRHCG